jgi:hypothetical protein
MTVVVFAGPTIGRDEATALLPCDYRPPAAQGDVYRAARARPRAIAIVDGYFHGVAAVWHKEILWAMAEGIHVFGASSMGALRAAELADFGMRGVGRIFADYRSGVLTDDDEVAVLHAPAEMGYAALSEAMVNIRATLASAVAAGVLTAEAGAALCRAAKQSFYQQRNWPTLLEDGAVSAAERAALADWLPAGRIDLKRADAQVLLAELAGFLAGDPPPMQVDYRLEWTDLWDSVVAGTVPDPAPAAAARIASELVLDELRLDPERFAEVRRAALLRLLAARTGQAAGPESRRAALMRFRTRHGLLNRQAVERWQAENDLDDAALDGLIAEEALVADLVDGAGADLARHMLSELRACGGYGALAARARGKQAAVAAHGGGPARALYPLAQWYFETRLKQAVPQDLAGFAREIGLQGRDELARILMHELVYYSSRSETEDQSTREEPITGRS